MVEKEFNANLTFRNGNIAGNCDGVSGRFAVKGTYTTAKPFRFVLIIFFWSTIVKLTLLSVKLEFEEAFGIQKIGMIIEF